jgi:NTE family protein
VYLGASFETGNAVSREQSLSWSELRRAGLLFIGIDSVLGPVYFGAGRTQGGDNSLYLIWGRLQ